MIVDATLNVCTEEVWKRRSEGEKNRALVQVGISNHISLYVLLRTLYKSMGEACIWAILTVVGVFEYTAEFVVHVLDKGIASAIRGNEIGNEKIVAIIDLHQISYKNVDAHGLISGFQFLQAYYPERLATLYILNMPRFFVSVWKMISYFLEKATLDKIVIVTSEEERKRFLTEVGKEALPEELGGEAKFVALQDVEATRLKC